MINFFEDYLGTLWTMSGFFVAQNEPGVEKYKFINLVHFESLKSVIKNK